MTDSLRVGLARLIELLSKDDGPMQTSGGADYDRGLNAGLRTSRDVCVGYLKKLLLQAVPAQEPDPVQVEPMTPEFKRLITKRAVPPAAQPDKAVPFTKAIPDVETAWRCVRMCASYLDHADGSPRAGADLQDAARIIERAAREAPVTPPAAPASLLELTERIARRAHLGQTEESTGADYITHVERVVAMVDGERARAVAWLHDVLEDAPLTAFGLELAGVPLDIVQAVEILTRSEPYGYQQYIRAIVESDNALALAVKHADLLDHLRPNCPERLRARYDRALVHISHAVAAREAATDDK